VLAQSQVPLDLFREAFLMRWHRIGLGLALGAGALVVGSSSGCTPADTGEKIEITGTSPGSDVPQTQEEYMKRMMEKQKGSYQEAGSSKKK
jgi:hypothetical protein